MAASVFLSVQGGTGIGTATAGDIGDCLKVLDDSPFTYELGTCSTGGFSYPFTPTSYGNSTSTPIGFLNGLFSTASSTFNGPLFITNLSQGLLYNGRNGLTQTAATGTISAGAGISVTAGQSVIGSGLTITNDGVTSISATAPLVNNQSTGAISLTCPTCSTIANPFTVTSYGASTSTTIGFIGGLFANSASSSFTGLLNMVYASSTALSVSSSFAVTPLTSALTLTGADGTFAEYAGATCTNQFVRVLSALGAATCATVVAGDVDLADLTATNGSLTFSGAYDGSTARTVGLNLANANTWTALQTFTNATSTFFSASTYLRIPSTTPTTDGELGLNTVQASSSLRFYDGAAVRSLYAEQDRSVILASSTLSAFANGTSTILLANFLRPTTITRMYCKTSAGTVTAQLGDGAASSTSVTCNATGVDTILTSNNAYTMRENFLLAASSTSATFDILTLTITSRSD